MAGRDRDLEIVEARKDPEGAEGTGAASDRFADRDLRDQRKRR